MNIYFLKISKLVPSGDIENNQGRDFDKVVTGSFHQRDKKF